MDEEKEFFQQKGLGQEGEGQEFCRSPWFFRGLALVVILALLGNFLALLFFYLKPERAQLFKMNRELSQQPEIQTYREAVVLVETPEGQGTGFNIDPRGLIITNAHVVGRYNLCTLRSLSGKSWLAKKEKQDSRLDLAFLRLIPPPGEKAPPLPALKLSSKNPGEIKAGERVYIIGNPLSCLDVAVEGKVLGWITLEDRKVPSLVVDMPIYRGHSGSPVLDSQGEVIGVIFASAEVNLKGEKKAVGLAIPVLYFEDKLCF